MAEENVAIVCFLLLFSSFRQTVLQDIPFTDYCKFSFTRCITTGLFKKIYNTSPQECLEECSRRLKCQSFNYRQRFQGCELSTDVGTENNLTYCIGYVHSNIGSWNSEWRKFCKSLNCSVGQTCVKDKAGNGSCIYTECARPDVSNGTVLLGNVYDVGSRLKIQCNDGKVLIGMDTTKCLENGTWTALGRCLNYKCPADKQFCYRFELIEHKNWSEALEVCRGEVGDLMIPHEDTFQFFMDQAQQHQAQSFWIGGYAKNTPLEYVTVKGNSIPKNFPYWAPNQPDNYASQETCLEMRKSLMYKLNDYNCKMPCNFICQIFPNP